MPAAFIINVSGSHPRRCRGHGGGRSHLLALEATCRWPARLGVVGERGPAGEVPGRQLLVSGRSAQADAGETPRPGWRRRSSLIRACGSGLLGLHVQHAGERHVVGVVALAPDEAVALDRLRLGTTADLDLVERDSSVVTTRLYLRPQLLGRPQHRLPDVAGAGAASPAPDIHHRPVFLDPVGSGELGRQRGPASEAALQPVLLLEPLLDRVELAGRGQALQAVTLAVELADVVQADHPASTSTVAPPPLVMSQPGEPVVRRPLGWG